ncbi:MAG TPA: DNA mismatch repair endonuclease MutL, partial [Isosphaeraceae bacterium]|nr:DNA mismatch repair endonuclease MutL [Isosphaeraceae bacterium]
MGIIRQLPPAVINQIAAGEVVERPASAVKELLENAIDAQATRIDLAVERGGKDLVRVADDGLGMVPDDLLLAFQPHATSKLANADDLFRISTLGFRGEALAAIAEVAKVRCQTRQAGTALGSELTIEGGVSGAVKDCGCPPGTVIEVRNLFYNTPVRRTFLKSDITESGHVVDMFSRIALAHPELHLTYRSGGKVVHDLPPVAGTRDRIAIFFGRELAESLLWIEGQLDDMHLWGYVAHPSQSRSTAKGQFLFLGGRYVRDRSLSHALNEAYRGLLMVGRMPVAFLHLEIPPEQVDVNVHPTKIEVRFRDSQRVYSHLLSTLRQTFLKSDLHARLQPTQEPAASGVAASTGVGPYPMTPAQPGRMPGVDFDSGHGSSLGRLELAGGPSDRQTVGSWFEPSGSKPRLPESLGQPVPPPWAQSLPLGPAIGPGEAFDEFSPDATPATGTPAQNQPALGVAAGMMEVRSSTAGRAPPDREGSEAPATALTQPFEAGEQPALREGSGLRSASRDSIEPVLKAIQVHDSYLIAETGDGMMVIDQHALHERILYEELRSRVARGNVESQRLLVPEPVDLTASEAASLVEQTELLAQLGLEIEPFGGDTVLVQGIPAMLRHVVPARLVRDLAEHLRTQPLPPTREGLLGELLHMVACKAAVKAGQPLSPVEIAALLDRGNLVANSHHCPHGRP